ncbi:microfibril-associated glycoprotein 4-like [Crassostrea angulata]|uniref:microfibril-associated glycoprotein 4-like n=1 Tax=Magallana angulata TaxID=2784310 RepID=UPI0022B09959|nr:microfibril-associated glycoprotein 4-like [Crassostrea angulata]
MSMLSSILWVLFCVCPTSIATVLVSKLYIANLVHDEKLFNEFLVLQRPSSSLVECASLCGPHCVYYGFNSKTKKCRIHSCSALVDAVEEAGWRYYASNDPDYKPKDCLAVYGTGHKCSGVYEIYPAGGASTDVVCDMETKGGGWTLIQNRFEGSEGFFRDWQDYKSGFGSAPGEYWIGNDVIHELTKANTSSLYVTITLTNGTTLFELYETFSISSEPDNYTLYIGGEASGTLGNQMTETGYSHTDLNGMMFSTPDRDNDRLDFSNCAFLLRGGWWFNACHSAYLNGPYKIWHVLWDPPFRNTDKVQKTSMMIRRR